MCERCGGYDGCGGGLGEPVERVYLAHQVLVGGFGGDGDECCV